MIIGTVLANEWEDAYQVVADLLRDRHVSFADSETDYYQRARGYLDRARPGHSDVFAAYVIAVAWSQHAGKVYRLEIPAVALRLVADYADTLTDQPAAHELRAAVAKAVARAGWATTSDTPTNEPGDSQ